MCTNHFAIRCCWEEEVQEYKRFALSLVRSLQNKKRERERRETQEEKLDGM